MLLSGSNESALTKAKLDPVQQSPRWDKVMSLNDHFSLCSTAMSKSYSSLKKNRKKKPEHNPKDPPPKKPRKKPPKQPQGKNPKPTNQLPQIPTSMSFWKPCPMSAAVSLNGPVQGIRSGIGGADIMHSSELHVFLCILR